MVSPHLANELLARIVDFMDRSTLKVFVLTDRRFYALGTEKQVRNLMWHGPGTAARNPALFTDRERSRIVSLVILFGRDDRKIKLRGLWPPGCGHGESTEQTVAHYPILNALRTFTNLSRLVFTRTILPDDFFDVLEPLQSLEALVLHQCLWPRIPDKLPYTLPRLQHFSSTHHDSPVRGWRHWDLFHLFPLVPHISSDDFYNGMYSHCSPESLTLGGSVMTDPYGGSHYLQLGKFDLRRLKSYTIIHPHIYTNVVAPADPLEDLRDFQFPSLLTLSAPFFASSRIVPSAPLLEHITIPDRFPDTESAVDFIESVTHYPLSVFALSLATWDIGVLERISNTLPYLQKLEILYYAEGNLDLHMIENPLKKLNQLTTFHLCKLPPPSLWEAYFPDEDFDSLEEVEPSTIYDEPGAFPQYTAEEVLIKRWGCADVAPALVRVQLGLEPGQVWIRSAGDDLNSSAYGPWQNLWEERIGWSVREEGKWGCVRHLGKYMRRKLHEVVNYKNWL
ncbi:hypothetical protein C8F01DRAFT_1139175 [Mycena amicta]|nr:hypothetical protein C8F01DRAFT_1139175 [Mycena amicta]